MTTSYTGEAELKHRGLEGLFDPDAPRFPTGDIAALRPAPALAPIPTSAPPPPAVSYAARPLDGEASTSPASVAAATLCGRGFRTVAPIAAADLLSLSLCGLIANLVLSYAFPEAASHFWWVSAVGLFPLAAVYWMGDLYSEIWVHPIIEIRQLARLNTVALCSAAVGGALSPPLPLWCAAAWAASFALVPLCRMLARAACAGRGWWGYPTLVIGSGPQTEALVRALLSTPASGLRPVLLTDPQHERRTSLIPVINDPAQLHSTLRGRSIRHAVVCVPELSNARRCEIVDEYAVSIPHLLVLTDPCLLPTLWSSSRHGGRLSGIEVRNGLLLATLRVVKRGGDLAVATAALVTSLPLFALIMLVVKLTSPGPIFFGHTRIGRNGRPFKAWKFRTMHRGADVMLRKHLERFPAARAEWARDQKLRDDPRVTPLGRFLRTTSLDELPQIWNVLKGDMSLVGPRPIVEAEVCRYGEAFPIYTAVKPGITGLWQVSGRTDIGYDDRVRLDLFYIRHWTPWFDVYILARTVVALASRSGAY